MLVFVLRAVVSLCEGCELLVFFFLRQIAELVSTVVMVAVASAIHGEYVDR